MYIWAEWMCKRCSNTHTARYDVIIQFADTGIAPRSSPRKLWTKDQIKIDDIAYNREHRPRKTTKGGGSKVYAPARTETLKIMEAIKEFMLEYYSMTEDTLNLEVCAD